MKINCQDYRASMQLLALKKKLEEGIADPKEEAEVRELIRELEAKLEID